MSLPRRSNWIVLMLLVVVAAAGCGGGGTTSHAQLQALAQEYEAARKEIDPEKRARGLIAVASKQQQLSDTAGVSRAVSDALRAVDELSDGAALCSIYARLAILLKQREDSDGADKALQKARTALDQIEDVDGLLTAMEDLATAQQLALGDRAAANQMMSKAAERAAQIPDSGGRILYLCELSKRLHKQPWSNRAASATALQRAVQECDALGGARAATSRIRVADVHRQHDATPEAVATLTEAKGFAEQESDPVERVYALVSIAQALGGLDQPDVAQATLVAAEQAVATIASPQKRQEAAQHVDAMKRGIR